MEQCVQTGPSLVSMVLIVLPFVVIARLAGQKYIKQSMREMETINRLVNKIAK